MNLRESLEGGDGMDDVVSGREDYLTAWAYVAGWGEGVGRHTAVSTDGVTLRIHDLTRDTRSAPILRHLRTTRDVLVATKAQLDAIEYWEPESDTWGPDPWSDGDPDITHSPGGTE